MAVIHQRSIEINGGAGIQVFNNNDNSVTISMNCYKGQRGDVLTAGQFGEPEWMNPFQLLLSHPLCENNKLVAGARDDVIEALKRYLMTIKMVESND